MNDQEKKSNIIKFYTQYANTYTQPSNKKYIKSNLSKKNLIKSKKNNIIVYSSNNFPKTKSKDISLDKSIKYYNKTNKIIIDNFPNNEKLINNSVNINLINSMNNITFCDQNSNNANNKINLKKNCNITVNKKISFTKDKKNVNNYKNFGINIALKGLKENNNNINQKIKDKDKIINVNKSSMKKYPNKNLSDLKIINSSSNIFSMMMQNKIKNKNNYINRSSLLTSNEKENYPSFISPKNISCNLSISKPKSEEKNFKKSKKKNSKYNNIFLSNFDDKLNNILISGNNTTTNNNFNKHFFSRMKSENNKNSKEKKINLKISNLNIYSNNTTSNKKFNKQNSKMTKNKLNHDLINSFEKIEVNKKPLGKEIETRNESFNLYLEKTHQNSWTSSKEKINSDNFIYYINKKEKNQDKDKERKIEKTPKNISSKVIYNKKQLSLHNNKPSFNDIKKILSPNFDSNKKRLLSGNLDNFCNFNDNYENNNLVLNEFTYKKKIPMKNIYKKPDMGFINNSFLLIGKDSLIKKSNLNHLPLYSEKMFFNEENTKRKFNEKLNKFLQKSEAITESNKDKTEFSILLNSENNNNSKEITMDTNMNLNEISIITRLNNKVTNNNNFIRKYYSYFVKVNKQEMSKPSYISKKRINRDILKLNKIPIKTIYYISKTRKISYNIIPKIDICYFRKINIDTTLYDINYKIKPILTERTSTNENNAKYKNKIITTTKRIVNIEKYDNNYANKKNLKKTEKGLKLLEKIADKRISLSSLLTKKNKKIYEGNINIKNDFIENLNKISNNNYEIILNQISNLIISNKDKGINVSKIIKNQNDFIDIIISKGSTEKKYLNIYAKLCKDLFVALMTIIGKYNNDIDIFDKITKEKSLKKLIKTKILILIKEEINYDSNIIFYFICELLENKIFSIKTGFEILDLLFKQYMNDLNFINLSGIEILLTKMKKLIYEKNNLEHIQRYNKYIKTHLYSLFQKNSKALPKYLYYRIFNLLQNSNKEFIIAKSEYTENKIYQMIKADLENIINNKSDIKKILTELKHKYDIEINKNKNIEIWEFFYYYIENCIDLINSENKAKIANEYINNFIYNFSLSVSNEVWEILHYKLISLFLSVNEICVENIYMFKIMGFLLYTLINNKLFFIKDLNNFLEKENYIIINIAKVVKYSIIFAEKNAKKFHNDFKQTKLFFGNDIFYNVVTVPLKKNFYEI